MKQSVKGVKQPEIGVKQPVIGVRQAETDIKQPVIGVRQAETDKSQSVTDAKGLYYILTFLGFLFLICWVMAFCDLIGFDNWQ